MKIVPSVFLVVGLLATWFSPGGSISVGETRVENAYPEQIAFEVDVSSDAPITRIELHLSVRGDSSTTILVASFEPGTTTTARAEWKTRREGIPPGAPYTCAWQVWDEAGNTIITPGQEGMTLDPRRPWSSRIDDHLGVWWYEGDADFGQRIFDLASTSLSRMELESGLQLPFPLHIVIYPDFDTFAEWHDYVLDWVGGEAYPSLGLTVQIISPSDSWEWVQSVICHEVAHLFFFQATYHPLSMGPHTWIEEGYAKRHECVSSDWIRQKTVLEALRSGSLIPLRLLTGSFSGDDERIALLYAESWSAMTFLDERWGEQGVADLMQAFREGADSNDALRAATGMDFEEFQRAWWEWLGGAPGAYPTPATPGTAAPLPLPPSAATDTPTASAKGPLSGGAWPCAAGGATILVGLAVLARAAWAGDQITRRHG